jgi:hypothetical protein
MLAALPVIVGIQFLLSFIALDMAATPSRAIHSLLSGPAPGRAGTGVAQTAIHSDRAAV